MVAHTGGGGISPGRRKRYTPGNQAWKGTGGANKKPERQARGGQMGILVRAAERVCAVGPAAGFSQEDLIYERDAMFFWGISGFYLAERDAMAGFYTGEEEMTIMPLSDYNQGVSITEMVDGLEAGLDRAVLRVLSFRVGRGEAISRGDLVRMVGQHGFSVHERALRLCIQMLRKSGQPI